MIFLLKTWYFRWRNRDQTPRAMAEMYLILLYSARRCAYDLRHAADALPESLSEVSRLFHDRSHWWLKLFAPDQIKEYRHDMQRQIEKLEHEVFKLRAELRSHNIESKVPTNDPF